MKDRTKNRGRSYVFAAAFVFGGVLLDQWTKALASEMLRDGKDFPLIKGIFSLTYLENRGAAFGVLQNQRAFFFLSAALMLAFILWFYRRVPMSRRFLLLRLCAVLAAAGTTGNLIDRIRLNYVVDFLYFELIDFPVFNVADIFVTVSAAFSLTLLLFYYKEEDIEQILHSGNGGRED